MRKLTPKQQKVVNQLLKDPSLKLCSEVTGVSYDYVRGLHTKAHILEILDKSRKRVAERAEVDAALVLSGAHELFQRCMQHVPVFDKEGNPVITVTPAGELAAAYQFDSSGAARALKLMGDHISVAAFGPGGSSTPPAPHQEDAVWTVKIVHMTKDQYDAGKGNGKPVIDHRP